MGMEKTTRRRGAALEADILDAAWAELASCGYTKLTMEAVAKRAKTSRPVLYRRWPDRAQLAVAAIQNYLDKNVVRVPDMGNVRKEMISLMQQYINRGLPVIILCALEMNDYYRETHSLPTDLRQELLHGEDTALQEVLLRAVQRGDIDGRKLTSRVKSVTSDILRHEFLMTLTPPSLKSIEEVIDQIFLPLVNFDK